MYVAKALTYKDSLKWSHTLLHTEALSGDVITENKKLITYNYNCLYA